MYALNREALDKYLAKYPLTMLSARTGLSMCTLTNLKRGIYTMPPRDTTRMVLAKELKSTPHEVIIKIKEDEENPQS